MASRSPSPPSPPNSPPASLLIETIDHRTGNALAQSVDQPSHDLPTAVSPLVSSLSGHLDHIDIPHAVEESSHDLSGTASPAVTDHTVTPHNPNLPAQPTYHQRPGHLPQAILPSLANYDEQHPFGILNSVHLRLRIGRDTSGNPNMMPPAPPARIVQRNDFKGTPPNGDPKDNTTTTAANTPAQGVTREDQGADNFLGNAMKQSFPPKLEGVAEARHKSEAKRTEDVAGLGPELEAAVLAKREYNEKFGAFRTRWTKVQFALADKAEKMRGRATAAEMRPVVSTIGAMFALGKAVDLAAFPGWSFGEFDEVCATAGHTITDFLFAPGSNETVFAVVLWRRLMI